MKNLFLQAAIAIQVLCLAAPWSALAEERPEPPPPCTPPVWPPPAVVGAPPSVAIWKPTEYQRDSPPQPCIGWEMQRFASFAAVVGTFQASGMDAVLSRIAAITAYSGMRYWSVSDRRLEPLVKDAFAVEGPHSNKRADFTPAEMQAGQELAFAEHDNRSSDPVLYRIRVIERSANHLVVDIANTNKIRLSLLTLFEPGDLRTALFISGSADGTWTCYALSGFHPTALTEFLDNHKSPVNRLIALYGHITASDDSVLPWAK